MKGKGIAKKINGKCFIYNKSGHQTKDWKNSAYQGNTKK